jgi:hypothetical protein
MDHLVYTAELRQRPRPAGWIPPIAVKPCSPGSSRRNPPCSYARAFAPVLRPRSDFATGHGELLRFNAKAPS